MSVAGWSQILFLLPSHLPRSGVVRRTQGAHPFNPEGFTRTLGPQLF
jgi:hypothetical protein